MAGRMQRVPRQRIARDAQKVLQGVMDWRAEGLLCLPAYRHMPGPAVRNALVAWLLEG